MTRTCESPSRTTRSKPVSNAKLKALPVATASTSMDVKGSMVLSVRETITWPSWFRRITPNPAHFSDSNNAPSKFNLYSGTSFRRMPARWWASHRYNARCSMECEFTQPFLGLMQQLIEGDGSFSKPLIINFFDSIKPKSPWRKEPGPCFLKKHNQLDQ